MEAHNFKMSRHYKSLRSAVTFNMVSLTPTLLVNLHNCTCALLISRDSIDFTFFWTRENETDVEVFHRCDKEKWGRSVSVKFNFEAFCANRLGLCYVLHLGVSYCFFEFTNLGKVCEFLRQVDGNCVIRNLRHWY